MALVRLHDLAHQLTRPSLICPRRTSSPRSASAPVHDSVNQGRIRERSIRARGRGIFRLVLINASNHRFATGCRIFIASSSRPSLDLTESKPPAASLTNARGVPGVTFLILNAAARG